jgi:exosome complex RNA-binding protein Rrp4
MPFEVTVGMNGCVWVQAGSVKHTLAVLNAIERSEGLTDGQCEELVARLVAALLDR